MYKGMLVRAKLLVWFLPDFALGKIECCCLKSFLEAQQVAGGFALAAQAHPYEFDAPRAHSGKKGLLQVIL